MKYYELAGPVGNLAAGKTAIQSSFYGTDRTFGPENAVDSRRYPFQNELDHDLKSCSHTAYLGEDDEDHSPFWQVDLGSRHLVLSVSFLSRIECCGERNQRLNITVAETANGPRALCMYYPGPAFVGKMKTFFCEKPLFGPVGNLAAGKKAIQSSFIGTGAAFRPEEAVDSRRYPLQNEVDPNLMSCSHTDPLEDHFPFWQVDLGSRHLVLSISFLSRIECCVGQYQRRDLRFLYYILGERNQRLNITVAETANGPRALCMYYPGPAFVGEMKTIFCKRNQRLNITVAETANGPRALCMYYPGPAFVGEMKTIFCPIGNLAAGKTAIQTSYLGLDETFHANRAVDSRRYPKQDELDLNLISCSHTADTGESDEDNTPYWQVDLGSRHLVTSVSFLSRIECCGDRNQRLNITVAETATGPRGLCMYYPGPAFVGQMKTFFCEKPVFGQFLRISRDRVNLNTCEIEVYGYPLN
ncbi:uncharacterized protein LOC110446525 [Mizuhopecten yessoensis]|uniref:uncharacterized protein LOC110446525 n=1 Tax=Mizuhopecten yessoensis TaxID=6573 RepID=UPI000B459322|nr:uncharacterized protein LOC110446525 [Mizuhopecten yessoensis]